MGVVLECKSGTCWCQPKFMSGELLRSLPSIERLLTRPVAERAACELSRDRVRDLLREIIEEIREEVRSQEAQQVHANNSDSRLLTPDLLLSEIENRLEARTSGSKRPSLRRLVNATGVILHTNLGRAPLARAAIEALSDVACHYSNLEY